MARQTELNEFQNLKEEIKKINRVYACHKYFGRKPWHPIAQKIKEYSLIGDKVLDPFLGSGVTALESINIGRNFLGIDLNPMSKFITESTIDTDYDKALFEAEIETLTEKMTDIVQELYMSDTPCQQCQEPMMLLHVNNGPKFEPPFDCKLYCTSCGRHSRKSGLVRKVNSLDEEKMNKAYNPTKWVPETNFPKAFLKDRFSYKGIKKVKDMYTSRNLYFLSELLHEIKHGEYANQRFFLLAFSNTVLHASKLKGENVRPLNTNNYWVPDDRFEENPWMRFLDRINLVKKSKKELLARNKKRKLGVATIQTASSLMMELEDSSIDYIITDPPYGEAIQYFELSFIWNAWLQTEYQSNEEVIINSKQNKKVSDYIGFMQRSVNECARVLRVGSYYTLCFQNKDFEIWSDLLNAFKSNNFELKDVDIVKLKGDPFNGNWKSFSPSADIYITFKLGNYVPLSESMGTVEHIVQQCLDEGKDEQIPDLYNRVIRKLIREVYQCRTPFDASKLSIESLLGIMEGFHAGN
jgi:DNA modification methylase